MSPSGPTPRSFEIATVVAEAVLGIEGVAMVAPGPGSVLATYGAGGRVRGVGVRSITHDGNEPRYDITVHMVAKYGPPMDEVARSAREAALTELASRFGYRVNARVFVRVVDVEVPEGMGEAFIQPGSVAGGSGS